MKYTVQAHVQHKQEASVQVKANVLAFGVTPAQDELSNPVELLLSAFAACCLKNVERFAAIMGFEYEDAHIEVVGTRQVKPTKLVAITYVLSIKSNDAKLNVALLHKNIQNHGTIYNTLKDILSIQGEVNVQH